MIKIFGKLQNFFVHACLEILGTSFIALLRKLFNKTWKEVWIFIKIASMMIIIDPIVSSKRLSTNEPTSTQFKIIWTNNQALDSSIRFPKLCIEKFGTPTPHDNFASKRSKEKYHIYINSKKNIQYIYGVWGKLCRISALLRSTWLLYCYLILFTIHWCNYFIYLFALWRCCKRLATTVNKIKNTLQ